MGAGKSLNKREKIRAKKSQEREEEPLGTRGAYHLAKISGNFGLNSNGKVIFRKFRSEIVEYLQRYSSVRWNMRSAECGVRSVENAECGKCGV